jgi:hypothetical protein
VSFIACSHGIAVPESEVGNAKDGDKTVGIVQPILLFHSVQLLNWVIYIHICAETFIDFTLFSKRKLLEHITLGSLTIQHNQCLHNCTKFHVAPLYKWSNEFSLHGWDDHISSQIGHTVCSFFCTGNSFFSRLYQKLTNLSFYHRHIILLHLT